MAQQIDLYIDRIVLSGFDDFSTVGLSRQVQEALGQVIRQQGLPRRLHQSGAYDHLNGGEIELNPRAHPRQNGRALAKGIYQGIGKAK